MPTARAGTVTPTPDVMSVLIVGTRAPTVGGITSVIDDQVDGLGARGLAVATYNTGALLRSQPGRASWENIRAAVADAVAVRRDARRLRPTIVAVHTVGSPVPPLARALLLAVAVRSARRPVVVHLHAYDLQASLPARSFRLVLGLLGHVAGAVVVLYDSLVAPVQAVVRCPVVALPNGIDCSYFSPLPTDPHEPEGSGRDDAASGGLDEWPVPMVPGAGDEGASATRSADASSSGVEPAAGGASSDSAEVRLVFVGTVGRRKGVDALMQALRRDPHGFSCLVIGDAAEEPREVYDEVVRAAGDLVRAGVVRFAGARPRAWIRDQLRQADVFVLPSTAEGMPMALLEAMACRLAVVVTDVGAMGSIVRDASAGHVVPPGDPVCLAEALQLFRDDADLRSEAANAARRGVEVRFDRDLVLDRVAELYTRVAGGRRG